MSVFSGQRLFLYSMVLLGAGACVLLWLMPRSDGPPSDGRQTTRRDQPWTDSRQMYRRPADTLSEGKSRTEESDPSHPARPDEVLLRFKDENAYREFLRDAGRHGLLVLGGIDALRVVRAHVADPELWAGAARGLKDAGGPNFLAEVPGLPQGGVQDDAVGFGGALLPWLGIRGDNQEWGKGVKVAVLDTGVSGDTAIPTPARSVSLLASRVDPSENGHGTAVASLIAGAPGSDHPGIAPAVSLLSYQVADANGVSDVFLLAQGIVDAVDAGAKILNISLGSPGDSPVLRAAVEYAMERGGIVVASAGNNGLPVANYPAAYDGVLSVGSVDARGERLDFSNTGWSLDLAAPGYDLPAALPGGMSGSFSGTSASAPLVSGAIAAAMSEFGLSAREAAQTVLTHLNEAGPGGADTNFGSGILDVGRIMNKDTRGIHDVAVASQSPGVARGSGVVEVVVQNRGTETLPDSLLTVHAGAASESVRTGRIAPGEWKSRTVYLGKPSEFLTPGFLIESSVALDPGNPDANPSNNSRRATVVAPPEQP